MSENALVVFGQDRSILAPKTLQEAMQYAEIMAKSSIVPAAFQGKPGDILIAVQLGMEVGVSPVQALANICVINGRPTMWGDLVLALVKSSGKLVQITEEDDGSTATCTVQRKGDPAPIARTFSQDDAKRANLAGKAGPWQQYPGRMRQMRARAFALRDVFPDVLKGLAIREEVDDYEVVATTPQGNLIERPKRKKREAAAPAPAPEAAPTQAASDPTPAPAAAATAPVAATPSPTTPSDVTEKIKIGILETSQKSWKPPAKAGEAPQEAKRFWVVKYVHGAEAGEATCWDSDLVKVIERARDAGLAVEAEIKTRADGKRRLVAAVAIEPEAAQAVTVETSEEPA